LDSDRLFARSQRGNASLNPLLGEEALNEPFLADDETTWPTDLTDLLAENLEELKAYHKFERDLERRYAKGDWKARYHPPANPSQVTRMRVLEEANALVDGASVVGYHCTRLVDHEVDAILTGGMKPLSAELVQEKISALVASGLVPADVGSLLLTENATCHSEHYGRRLGMSWFVFARPTLREENGVIRLLSQWGGEATYLLHEQTPDVIERLRKLGTPCIVEAAITVRDIQTFCTVGERLVCHYLAKRRVRGENPDWEGYVEVPTPRVRRIIRRGDGVFERLTNCQRWKTKL